MQEKFDFVHSWLHHYGNGQCCLSVIELFSFKSTEIGMMSLRVKCSLAEECQFMNIFDRARIN